MTANAELPWSRYVALGDSVTEGVGDPRGGSLRGWADRLADALRVLNPKLEYHNLARRSLTTKQIRDMQLEPALELRPDLVSVVAGMNDLIARRFDPDRYRRELSVLVGAIAESDVTLLMGTLPNELPIARVMAPWAGRRLLGRLREVNHVIRAVASEHSAVCVQAPPGWRYTMAECSIDGTHPNASGHAHIAELCLEALCESAGLPPPLLDRDGCGWLSSSVGHLRWLASEGYLTKPPPVLHWLRA